MRLEGDHGSTGLFVKDGIGICEENSEPIERGFECCRPRQHVARLVLGKNASGAARQIQVFSESRAFQAVAILRGIEKIEQPNAIAIRRDNGASLRAGPARDRNVCENSNVRHRWRERTGKRRKTNPARIAFHEARLAGPNAASISPEQQLWRAINDCAYRR
nr:hypothetical protein [Marinicella sp. W31]MDC2877171.1 hypothetical protein [Marinicella sp. W31]